MIALKWGTFKLMIEVDTDQFGAALGQRIRIKDPSKKDEDQEPRPKKGAEFIENGVDMGRIRHWTASSLDDYPKYLYQKGRRLTTFTRLVCQFATTLHRDFDVPYEVKVRNFDAFFGD